MTKEIKVYTLEDAIKNALQSGKAKFDETVEVHINCLLDVKKPDQSVRFTTSLPHGTGKELKVAVFSNSKVDEADIQITEDDFKKIEKGILKAGTDFHVLISEPALMPKLAQVARTLGPAGVMPNPKNGTVTTDVKKAVEQFKKGKIEIRTEQTLPLIHTVIGKKSFDAKKLAENFYEIWNSLKSNKPSKAKPVWISEIFITTSMGKAFQVDLTSL